MYELFSDNTAHSLLVVYCQGPFQVIMNVNSLIGNVAELHLSAARDESPIKSIIKVHG
jgi:hypothetical protein